MAILYTHPTPHPTTPPPASHTNQTLKAVDAKKQDSKTATFDVDPSRKLDPEAYKESMQKYLDQTHDLYEQLFTELMTEKPEDPIQWAITWLQPAATV
jgi:hypothetical protein